MWWGKARDWRARQQDSGREECCHYFHTLSYRYISLDVSECYSPIYQTEDEMVLKQVRKMLIVVKTRHASLVAVFQRFHLEVRHSVCDVMMTAFQTSTSTTERRERGL